MGVKYSLTVLQVAQDLGFSKSYILRLIHQGSLEAKLQDAPVSFYLINSASVEEFKTKPKNKGGRPRKEN